MVSRRGVLAVPLAVSILAQDVRGQGCVGGIASSSCSMNDSCASSNNYGDGAYGNNEQCTIEIEGCLRMKVVDFNTELIDDYMVINGVRHSGGPNVTFGIHYSMLVPEDGEVRGNIFWSTGSLGTNPGWKLCFSSDVEGTTTMPSTQTPTTQMPATDAPTTYVSTTEMPSTEMSTVPESPGTLTPTTANNAARAVDRFHNDAPNTREEKDEGDQTTEAPEGTTEDEGENTEEDEVEGSFSRFGAFDGVIPWMASVLVMTVF